MNAHNASGVTPAQSKTILKKLLRYYGDPVADLHFDSLYQLCIAVVLSAQTTDKQVNAVTPKLFTKYHDFGELAQADINDVETIIKSTGFYHNKARNIIQLAETIMLKFNGTVPATLKELTSLPGVGRKSANVILSMGFDIPAFAVDTHVLRIAKRIGYTASDNPLDVEKAVTSTLDEKDWKNAHLILIRHGRVLCTARAPRCSDCPVNSLCGFADKTV
ncbi:MAG TPA: endonuclease III [Spirochaetota bacterium]|mgnify:FL=1|nr:endonuclease III [Spirochaetota bacterium]